MTQYHVCVVDDNEESAEVLRQGLEQNGYKTSVAHSGEEAIAACAGGKVDLILLDVNLPDIEGYEVCRRIKVAPSSEDTIVIFVTVRDSQADIASGFRAGAKDYITKPYNVPIVLVRVEAALRDRSTQKTASHVTLQDTAYTDPLTGLRNRRFLFERMQEEVEKAHRYNFPVSCVIFDVDGVRALDKDLGPVSLDDLLAEVAMSIKSYTRTFDILARYEGTQFAVVLPHSELDQALGYAEKILRDVDATTFADPCFPTAASVSVGITCCRNGSAKGHEYMLGEAMRNLLQAKSLPGHRIVGRELEEA